MMRQRVPIVQRRCAAAILTVAAFLIAACGTGSKQPSRESAAAPTSPPSAAGQAPTQLPSGSPIPLVDSRGRLVPAIPSAAPPQGGGAGLTWTTPSNWIEEPPASSMRKAQYSLPAAPGDSEPG